MKKMAFILLICLAASNVFAEGKPFQASLTPDVAIHSKETRIEGIALNIWGENPQSALAIGLINGSSGNSYGLSWGLVNYTHHYGGVELGVVNYNRGEFGGVQSAIFNYAATAKGLQLGTVNFTKQNFVGFQSGLCNIAGKLTGLQFGTINYAQNADSAIQIGLINIISENKWFTKFPEELAMGMIFVNWRF